MKHVEILKVKDRWQPDLLEVEIAILQDKFLHASLRTVSFHILASVPRIIFYVPSRP